MPRNTTEDRLIAKIDAERARRKIKTSTTTLGQLVALKLNEEKFCQKRSKKNKLVGTSLSTLVNT